MVKYWAIRGWGILTSLGWGVGLALGNGPNFEERVAPLLVQYCVECHQGDSPAGGLNLTTAGGFTAGGDSGPVIDAARPEQSYLLRRVIEGEMPPAKKGISQRLDPELVSTLSEWLSNGAPWPTDRRLDWFERTTSHRAGRDWWSLQPIVPPPLPSLGSVFPLPPDAGVAATGVAAGLPESMHPVDRFIRAELIKRGLSPAPRAQPRTLVRRLYVDLLGLPPTHDEIERFEQDLAPDAWEKLVDRLLEKPQYGERWGRYWLDLVRYAETSGYERDQEKPFAWKYRDWAIAAFNNDMPYAQFVSEQLAGDELASKSTSSLIATGFLRLGTWNDEPNEPLDYQYDRLEDLVHTTSSAFLGLTVKCARCHPHKFDPITQHDYYRMASMFWSGPMGQRDRNWLGGPSPDELGLSDVLAWIDLSADAPPLHLLKNGDRLQPREAIIPSTPSFLPELERPLELPPPGEKTTLRRRQFAEWMVDPRHPLTWRVIVNRVWQHHFGQGIVRTPNNFGFLADPPTHPELLNWLASEFLHSGGSIKQLHRLILTSETWKQDSNHPNYQLGEKLDSSNRSWWRAERRRLDAESLRDAMLAASGELDLQLGGESFKPTISAEALEGLSQKSSAWTASPPERQLRRSVYVYLKRGLLPPMMTTFDLGDTTQTCEQRDETIVPTQALTLLNNQFVHDRCAALAKRIVASTMEPQGQVEQAWLQVLSRRPNPHEIALSLQHLDRQRSISGQFERTNRLSSSVDGLAVDDSDTTRQALSLLCHALMNSNEFLFVD